MEHSYITESLSENLKTFRDLLSGASKAEYLYKPLPEKWCQLEIVCHLYDEERYDFRARTKHILENNQSALPPIDPVGWVKSRNYIEQKFEETLDKFLDERKKSVEWLKSLREPDWRNEYKHELFGMMSAEFFLTNWLAHDYLHFRQITSLKFNFLKHISGIDPLYAGEW